MRQGFLTAERRANRVLDLLIGVEHDSPGGVVYEADRDAALQLAAARFVQHPPNQPRAQDVELGLGC